MAYPYAAIRFPIPPEAPAGVAGVDLGLTLNEFFAEWAARVSGQTGWNKVVVKGAVKGFIALLLWSLGARLTGTLSKLLVNVAGYTTAGTILWDIFMQLYPGGIWGMAEATAVAARGTRAAAEIVTGALGAPPLTIRFAPGAVSPAPAPTPTRPRGI
jgi:hypothetical protein